MKKNSNLLSNSQHRWCSDNINTPWTITDDGEIDINRAWYASKNGEKINPGIRVRGDGFKKFPVKFVKNLKGFFDCSDCRDLESLEGAPEEVSANFSAERCNLKTLEGAPQKVGGSFSCAQNKNLKTLKSGPIYVGGWFACFGCSSLVSLEGPKEICGEFTCWNCESLENLKGMPLIGGDITCSSCDNLNSLEGAPEQVNGTFNCSANPKLTSLAHAPTKVLKSFIIGGCVNLKSLDTIPKTFASINAISDITRDADGNARFPNLSYGENAFLNDKNSQEDWKKSDLDWKSFIEAKRGSLISKKFNL